MRMRKKHHRGLQLKITPSINHVLLSHLLVNTNAGHLRSRKVVRDVIEMLIIGMPYAQGRIIDHFNPCACNFRRAETRMCVLCGEKTRRAILSVSGAFSNDYK
jgi:hypothetical protein